MWNNARFLNFIANGLIVVALSAFAIGMLYWLAHLPVFNLNRVVVEPASGASLQRVSAASLRGNVAQQVGGNFFTTDLDAVRQVFESVPWVSRAMVRREWPNALRVQLQEHQPLGLWTDTQVLNTRGRPFTANQAEAEGPDGGPLPIFAGPEGSGPLVRRRYFELMEWLRPTGLYPVRLTLSARHAWEAELNNGIVLYLGRDPGSDFTQGDPDRAVPAGVPAALRVQRFVRSLPSLQESLPQPIQSVDLRYPDGYALKLNGDAPTTKE